MAPDVTGETLAPPPPAATVSVEHSEPKGGIMHAINQIEMIPARPMTAGPDGLLSGNPSGGVHWACVCGSTGTCPQPIALDVIASHLAGG